MKIESLSNLKIKILLTQEDLKKYGLDYESLSCENAETRELIRYLTETAGMRFGFDRRGRQLMVRSLPMRDGGCVMYMNIVPQKNETFLYQSRGPFLYSFDNADALLGAVEAIRRARLRTYPESCLYHSHNEYRLVLFSENEPPKAIEHLLCEFGQRCGEGSSALAYTREYFELLTAHKAIEKIGEGIANYSKEIVSESNDKNKRI